MLWGVSIAMALADELGDFTEEELKTWNNLDGTVADLAALLERIQSEHRPPPPPRRRPFGFLFRRFKARSSTAPSAPPPTKNLQNP